MFYDLSCLPGNSKSTHIYTHKHLCLFAITSKIMQISPVPNYFTHKPMTDPWCCYIWCAMDPIIFDPSHMIAFFYQHHGSVMGKYNNIYVVLNKTQGCIICRLLMTRLAKWQPASNAEQRGAPQPLGRPVGPLSNSSFIFTKE